MKIISTEKSNENLFDVSLGNKRIKEGLSLKNAIVLDILIIRDSPSNLIQFSLFSEVNFTIRKECLKDLLKYSNKNCKFEIYNQNSIRNKKLFKISVSPHRQIQQSSFIEKSQVSKKVEFFEDCDPQCIHGVCKDSICFCKQGYMGINCSIGKST
jgi:hypothetical protein